MLSFEMGNTVTYGRFQNSLIECYQKCCQYCSLCILQSGKNCRQCPRAQKKEPSSYLIESQEHAETRGGEGEEGL